MLNLDFVLQPKTEQRIKRILDQYQDKEVFFQDIIKNQINELKNEIHNIEIDLKEFEERYHLSSEDFYNRFTNGELGDDEDFMLWSGIYEMQLDNQKKLLELR
ncbi:MAG TPA: hypothetical protein VK469_24345 [Candidatus Kapabacteria bacterium]|nr:hypothetical protein [Candidatus Kapabacteria bacterium]